TTVLMRYTLRLLTAQQFERAAILICACEKIRRDDPSTWGLEPITIGLWVGMASTPNTFDAAREDLKKLRNNEVKLTNHKFVLRSCPWCGEAVGVASFIELSETREVHIRCLNS